MLPATSIGCKPGARQPRLADLYREHLARDAAERRQSAAIDPDVLAVLQHDGPPSEALGFEPDPRFVELHHEVTRRYHELRRTGGDTPRPIAPRPTRPGPQACNAGITPGYRRPRPDDADSEVRRLRRLVRRLRSDLSAIADAVAAGERKAVCL